MSKDINLWINNQPRFITDPSKKLHELVVYLWNKNREIRLNSYQNDFTRKEKKFRENVDVHTHI